jgi:phosphoesterase RecJ-like protein
MLVATEYSTVDKIIDVLKKSRTFCLSGHENPDADVVGSELAMYSLINRLGADKKVDILNAGHPPKFLKYLKHHERVKSVKQVTGHYDALIVFECSGADRMGSIIDFKSQVGTVINIDHHLHNPNFGDINWVEPTTSSTSEMIFKIFERANVILNKDEAVSLYTGLVADTGCFRYGNTNLQTHTIGGKLVELGVPVAHVSESLYMNRSWAAFQIWSKALANIKFYFDRRVAVLAIPEKLYAEVGATPEDTDEIVNSGLQLGSAVVSILLKEKSDPTVVKVSLRSKGDWDINQVARKFGGGGHKNASGCSVEGTLENAERIILKEVEKLF